MGPPRTTVEKITRPDRTGSRTRPDRKPDQTGPEAGPDRTGLYSTVQHCTVLYSTVQYCTVLYSTVQYCTVLYSTVQYSTVLYITVQYCTVLYSTVRYSTVTYSTVYIYIYGGFSFVTYPRHHLHANSNVISLSHGIATCALTYAPIIKGKTPSQKLS